MSSTLLHNMANFGLLTAEIGSRVWGTPANFNGFRVLPSLLQRRFSTEANKTSHDVWPSPGLVHYICTFSGTGRPSGWESAHILVFVCELNISGTDLRQIHNEDVFGSSLELVWMSRLKVKGQGHQGQKTENCWVILIMAALCNRGPLYFCPVISIFYLLSCSIFFLFLA